MQGAFRPIRGLISCTGVTRRMGTASSCTKCSQVAGLKKQCKGKDELNCVYELFQMWAHATQEAAGSKCWPENENHFGSLVYEYVPDSHSSGGKTVAHNW